MANDQHSGRYPWGLKADKTEVTEEGLKVEAHKEYDVNKILKMLEECINYAKTYSDEILYPSYTLNTYVTLASLLDDAKGCIKQLATKLEGVTHYNNVLFNSRKDCISKLSKKISKLEEDNGHLQYEVDALVSQNQTLSERLNESEKKNEELAEKLKQLTLKNEEVTQNSKSLFEVLTCRSNSLKDKLNVSEKENEELKKMLKNAVTENDHLKYEVDAFDSQNKMFVERLNEYDKKNHDLKQELIKEKRIKLSTIDKLSNANLKIEELEARLEEKTKAVEISEKMLAYAPARNCINCDHYDVCMTVAERKARKANNYKPCSLWKKADEK